MWLWLWLWLWHAVAVGVAVGVGVGVGEGGGGWVAVGGWVWIGLGGWFRLSHLIPVLHLCLEWINLTDGFGISLEGSGISRYPSYR